MSRPPASAGVAKCRSRHEECTRASGQRCAQREAAAAGCSRGDVGHAAAAPPWVARQGKAWTEGALSCAVMCCAADAGGDGGSPFLSAGGSALAAAALGTSALGGWRRLISDDRLEREVSSWAGLGLRLHGWPGAISHKTVRGHLPAHHACVARGCARRCQAGHAHML